MTAQNVHRAKQQIVEIHGARLAENLVVKPEYGRRLLADVVSRAGRFRLHLVGRDAVVFRVADLRAEAARRVLVRRKIELQHGAFDCGVLAVIVVDGEVARQPDTGSLASKQPRAEGMKGGDPHGRGVAPDRAQQIADALLHHVSGPVRERHRQNRVRGYALPNQLGNAIGDDASLARSGARENKQWPFRREDGFPLSFVQSCEKVRSLWR